MFACIIRHTVRWLIWVAIAAQYGLWHPFMAPLTCNRRMTSPDHFQDTRHIEFDLSGSDIHYAPGDLLTIFPKQSAAALSAFYRRTQLDPNAWVKIEAADPSTSCHCSPMQVVRKCSFSTAYLVCVAAPA